MNPFLSSAVVLLLAVSAQAKVQKVPVVAAAETPPPSESPKPDDPPAETPPDPSITASSAAPTAQSVSSVQMFTPQQEAARTGFHVDMALDQSVGSGTFVNPDYYGYLASSLLLFPNYTFSLKGISFRAGVRQVFSFQYLRPIDSPTGRRVDFSDTRLILSAPAIYQERVTGIAFTPTLSMTLPISYESRLASTITRLTAATRLTKSVWKFDFNYSLAGSRAFHSNPAAVIAASGTNRDPEGNLILLCRGGQNFCGSAGMNSAWAISNALSVGFRATEKITFQATLDISNYWTYPVSDTVDEFTPRAVDSNGNPVARTGWGRADEMSGTLAAKYAFTDRFGISGGISTVRAPPRTLDNRAFRFPFIDFISTAENLTFYSVALEASY